MDPRGNSKHEFRNPKQNEKFKTPERTQVRYCFRFRYSNFGFSVFIVSNFDIRISDFHPFQEHAECRP